MVVCGCPDLGLFHCYFVVFNASLCFVVCLLFDIFLFSCRDSSVFMFLVVLGGPGSASSEGRIWTGTHTDTQTDGHTDTQADRQTVVAGRKTDRQ